MENTEKAGGGEDSRRSQHPIPSTTLTEQLEHALAASREAEQRLQHSILDWEDFSYSLNHELPGPLRAIHGFAELLLRRLGERLEDENRSYLERILKASERMDRLLRDTLTCCRLTHQPVELVPVDVEQLVRTLLQGQGVLRTVQVEVRPPLHPIRAHHPLLEQCLFQLLDNAAKFVPAGSDPKVRIWSELLPPLVRLWVEDNGIGIPQEYQSTVFDMFQRLQGDEYPGTGVGLAIVRKAASRMGGRVGVESEPGRGSRFWVELPAAGLST